MSMSPWAEKRRAMMTPQTVEMNTRLWAEEVDAASATVTFPDRPEGAPLTRRDWRTATMKCPGCGDTIPLEGRTTADALYAHEEEYHRG